jgi:hypothetical protein
MTRGVKASEIRTPSDDMLDRIADSMAEATRKFREDHAPIYLDEALNFISIRCEFGKLPAAYDAD